MSVSMYSRKAPPSISHLMLSQQQCVLPCLQQISKLQERLAALHACQLACNKFVPISQNYVGDGVKVDCSHKQDGNRAHTPDEGTVHTSRLHA